jgi:BirA family transcriptional regulator, biotin operon repressor / biotin---[acetyl-CoA-carboxylase] ligase
LHAETTIPELSAEAVVPRLRGRFGHPYRYVATCPSTQRLLAPEAPEGAVAVTDEQTEGRGRLGRRWEAPPGTSLLLSLVLRPEIDPERLPTLSPAAGQACADAIAAVTALEPTVKFPNDVLVRGRKTAGVLAEANGDRVVLGIGINVNQTRDQLPTDARILSGSLRTIDGVERERGPILATLLERVEGRYDAWCDAGLDALYDFLGARDFLRGRRVAVDGAEGHAVGIDRQGRLEIDTGSGRCAFESGEVKYDR